jgi:eukaryotic-like serine/threonine-protein kinase
VADVLGGRYRVGRLIGAGGMATVHEAEDTALGRRVAIKVLQPQYAADSAFVKRFDHEARSIAALNHPGIVQVYDVGNDGSTPYIVEEFVDGEPLKEVLRRGPLPADRIIDIGVQVATALDYAHQAGIVHRDVKPHNILIAPRGQAKLVDFGIAHTAGVAGNTDAGSVFGTAHYLAPEQVQGQPASPTTDVYSLGVVLYEMATGHPPFDGQTAVEIATKHVSAAPEPPSIVNPTVPPRLEQAILHALSKDPARRPRSGAELARELLQADEMLDRPTMQVPRSPGAPPRAAPQRPAPQRAPQRVQARPPVEHRFTRIEDIGEASWWPVIMLAVLACVLILGLIPVWSAVLFGLRS